MGFKQELLKKIQIDRLTEKILATIGPSGSEQKVDKGLFRVLLEMAEYRLHRERDLDLYLPPEGSEKAHILVLDNDLPFYKTTVSDIAMRKSPTASPRCSPPRWRSRGSRDCRASSPRTRSCGRRSRRLTGVRSCGASGRSPRGSRRSTCSGSS